MEHASMSDYVLKISRHIRHLKPQLSEEEFIQLITNHFPLQIQNYLLIARPRNIIAMIDLLSALETQEYESNASWNGGRRQPHHPVRGSRPEHQTDYAPRSHIPRERYGRTLPRFERERPSRPHRDENIHTLQITREPRHTEAYYYPEDYARGSPPNRRHRGRRGNYRGRTRRHRSADETFGQSDNEARETPPSPSQNHTGRHELVVEPIRVIRNSDRLSEN